MIDAGSIARELEGNGFEVLVIDADLAVSGDAPHVLRALGRNRPMIVIGDTGASSLTETARREVTYLARPLARDPFMLAIILALAEGRPARRSPRRMVPRLQASVDGVPARLLDVSSEGIRIELPERHRSSLPPFFTVRVPIFNANVVGQRVWVNGALEPTAGRSFWCGVRLARNPAREITAWQTLVEHAPASASLSAEPRSFF